MYKVPVTVPASEREKWKLYAVTHALTGDEPATQQTAVPAVKPDYKRIYLLDGATGVYIGTYGVALEHYGRLILSHSIHVTSSYKTATATYEALDPTDPDNKYYFWIGGERWWEPVED